MRLASGCTFTTGWMQHLAASVLRRPPRGSARREEESSPEGQGGQGEEGKMGMLWMPFTPCYADADARSKGRPWVPNPAATTSLLPDLVTRSGGQALAVSTPDGVPQRVVGYVELIGGDSSSSAAMGEDTQEAKALMIAIVPHLHRCDLVFILQSCILRNLESNLPKANKISHETLMGCAKYTTMQPQDVSSPSSLDNPCHQSRHPHLFIAHPTSQVCPCICSLLPCQVLSPALAAPGWALAPCGLLASVGRQMCIAKIKLASLCRSTTFLHTKTFTPDFGILWFKASRLLAEWSSLVTLHLPLLYILAFSSSIAGSTVKFQQRSEANSRIH
uniref:Uncharacterized protein n=1 Tax=Oryza rufipogon TaxID=4529 RepID=A0A0E0PSS8_ORYRU